jgi:hypothetical protein
MESPKWVKRIFAAKGHWPGERVAGLNGFGAGQRNICHNPDG